MSPTHTPTPRRRSAGRSPDRRGSILILVVALVVLLALMGTAYLSSTQGERYTSAQHQVNTQEDVALQGVVDSLQRAIVQDLFDQSQPAPAQGTTDATHPLVNSYRTPPGYQPPTAALATVAPVTDTYQNWDDESSKSWLASRIPTLRDNSLAYGGNAANALVAANLAGWTSISWPLAPSGNTLSFVNPIDGSTAFQLGTQYQPGNTYNVNDVVYVGSPDGGSLYKCTATVSGATPQDPVSSPYYWTRTDLKSHYRFEPTVMQDGSGAPGFWIYDRTSSTVINPKPIRAADADGDGVADSGYWPLPGGFINGIKYYAAIRVVDNAAALNASTAWSVTSDYVQTGVRLGANPPLLQAGFNPGFFPSDIGLRELMFDYVPLSPSAASDYDRVTQFWFHNNQSYDNIVGDPYPDGMPGAPSTPTARTDFKYTLQGDDVYHQLASRLDNPGYNVVFGSADPLGPFQSFTQADGLALASRFCLAQPNNSTSGNLEPMLQELSNQSAAPVYPIPTAPYDPAHTGSKDTTVVPNARGWFEQNFDFTADLAITGVNTHPLRSVIVTRNGVSNRTGGARLPDNLANTSYLGRQFYDVLNADMTPYDPPIADPPYYGGPVSGGAGGTTYSAGQWIKYRDANNTWRVYRCLAATTIAANAPPTPNDPSFPNVYLNPSNFWVMETWSPTAVRTSVNTATFPEMWRSFYNVMCDQWNTAPAPTTPVPLTGGNVTLATVPTASTTNLPGTSMFRNPIRTSGAAAASLSGIQMVQLRSALAAMNAMQLRSTGSDVLSRNIHLYDCTNGAGSVPGGPTAGVTATVFGGAKQPFITKVIVVNPAAANSPPWVAVELYNPYVQVRYPAGEQAPTYNNNGVTFYLGARPGPTVGGTTAIGLGCRLGLLTRSTTGLTIAEATDTTGTKANFSAAPALGPGQYLVLVSDATNVPTGITLPTAGPGIPGAFEVKPLIALVTSDNTAAPAPGELVLYRTRAATGVPKSNTILVAHDPMLTYDETVLTTPAGMVPFDQVDCTASTTLGPTDGNAFLYYRPTEPSAASSAAYAPPTPATATDYWKCVYPVGPTDQYRPGAGGDPMAPLTISAAVPFDRLGTGYNDEPTGATPVGRPWHVIQINNTDWPGPHTAKIGGATTTVYPIAGFPRLGDLLQVPYIGAYTISDATGVTPTEVNSVTMDSLYAEDQLTGDNPTATAPTKGVLLEQVGRFCPLYDTATKPTYLGSETDDPYRWASRLFDYFTVLAPHDDYMPNVDPNTYGVGAAPAIPPPVSVANGLGPNVRTANATEDGTPVQGLININTASWRVLSMLPLVRNTNGTVDVPGSAKMAELIVKYREAHGPFKSIFELNRVSDGALLPVQTFQSGSYLTTDTISFSPATDPVAVTDGSQVADGRQGMLTPNDDNNTADLGTPGSTLYPSFSPAPTPGGNYGPNSGVFDDFQTKFLALDRISNLITTRSDSFTCYVLVQGWRDGAVVVQKRSAFVLDRAPVGYQLDPTTGVRKLNTVPVATPVSVPVSNGG